MPIHFGEDLVGSTDDLLVQICLRLDRHFPSMEDDIKAEEATEAAGKLLLETATKLDSVVPELGDAIRKIAATLTGVTE